MAKDEAEAVRLFREAADAGVSLGALALAQAYKDGSGVAKDEAEALRWLRKAANAGSARAMTYLADQYADGTLGLPKDGAEAVSWYRKAADLGSARAVYDLALMYQEGRGVPKDAAEAARLFQAGDDLKNGSAMVHVGLTYDIGQRVTKDEAEVPAMVSQGGRSWRCRGDVVRRYGVSIRQWRCQGPSRGRSLVSPGGRARRHDGDDELSPRCTRRARAFLGRRRSQTLAGRRGDGFRAYRHPGSVGGGWEGRREGRGRRPKYGGRAEQD